MLLLVGLLFLQTGTLLYSQEVSADYPVVSKQSVAQPALDDLNKRCYALIQKKDFHQADLLANEALSAANKADYTKGKAEANFNMGQLSRYRFDYKHAIEFYVASIKEFDLLKDQKRIAALKNYIGEVFLLQKDELNALKNFRDAKDIFVKLNDLPGKAQSSQWIGKAYLQQKIYGRAIESLKESMDLWIEAGETEQAASIATLLSKVSYDLGDYEGALVYTNASLDMHSGLENKDKIAADFAMMSNIHLKNGDWDAALEANKMSESLRLELKDAYGLSEVYRNFGLLYVMKNNKPEADKWLTKATETLSKVPFQPGLPELYKSVSDAYSKISMPEEALSALQLYIVSKDSMYNLEKSTAMLELTTRYESEFSIKEKNEKIAQLNEEKNSERMLRYLMIGFIFLMLMLLYSLFINYKNKQKDNQLLTDKNNEIRLQNQQINAQKEALDIKNMELAEINQQLEEKNVNLDLMNSQLIKEMAERESLEKSSFARDHFLATVSHTMRNPLNSIIGLSHLLTDNNKDSKQAVHLRDLQFAANDLVVLINDLLDYSRIEAGKLTLDNREFSLTHLCKEVTNYFKTQKKIQVSFEKDNRLPEKLCGDPSRLNQIITNVVNHLSQHYETSEHQIFLSALPMNESQVNLSIIFKSNHSEFNNDILNNMYELFKGHPTVTDSDSGNATGKLSLAITKRLIELQNGTVQIVVNKENALEISILLPFKKADQPSVAKEKVIDMDGKLKGVRILVVEDNKINQLVVVNLLRRFGVEVTTADNGLFALDEMNKNDFDLILMDILMPEMDGYRATTEIRKMNSKSKSLIPIIALTASAFLTEKEKAQMFGMTDYIGKPFAPEELIDKIIEVISLHRSKTHSVNLSDLT